MFNVNAIEWSTKDCSAGHLVFAEAIATVGLLLVIFGVVLSGRVSATPFAFGGYIAAAYYFTSSTSLSPPV